MCGHDRASALTRSGSRPLVRLPAGACRAALAERLRGERGQTSVFIIGLLVVILMVIGFGVAVSGVQLDRKELLGRSDGAALHAASAVDEQEVYNGASRGETLPASLIGARRFAEDYLSDYATSSHPRLRGIRLARVSVDPDGTVGLDLTATSDPPLVGWFTSRVGWSIGLRVHSTSVAR